MNLRFYAFAIASILISAVARGQESVPAFPTAVGQGGATVGGRGGDVYHVTNLDDYDSRADEPKVAGSLRHAVRSTRGPRTIVFDVSGAIQLKAPLKIMKNRLTVAGQTSPGGITLCGYPLEITQSEDIVIRYLRVRTGDFRVYQGDSRPGSVGLDPGSANAIHIGDCQRVILDHVSASWSIDETLSVTGCRDVTIQHCIIAESLNDSFHPKGPHGYGSLVRGHLTAGDQAASQGGYTFFGNLWAHHRARNPSIGGQQRLPSGKSESERRRTDVNLVNNVVYNWGDAPTHRSQKGHVRINLIGNYYINGPARSSKYIFREGDDGKTFVYHNGNYHDSDQSKSHNGELIGPAMENTAFRDFDTRDQIQSHDDGSPFGFLHSVAQEVVSAEIAYQNVVNSAGASLWRDAIDLRLVDSVQNRSGSIIDSQESLRDEQGNLPGIDDVKSHHRSAGYDTDHDGMPNKFEEKRGLNPSDPQDGNGHALNLAGYTNLEVYLHGLVSPATK